MVAVLAAVAATYGQSDSVEPAPVGELVLLGAGSTAAVALNAALQCWGAARCGVTAGPLVGLAGRDRPHRAPPWLTTRWSRRPCWPRRRCWCCSWRVASPAVRWPCRSALNFYVLPVALIGTSIGLGVATGAVRSGHERQRRLFDDTLLRALASALFLAAPASVGYLLLAGPPRGRSRRGSHEYAGRTEHDRGARWRRSPSAWWGRSCASCARRRPTRVATPGRRCGAWPRRRWDAWCSVVAQSCSGTVPRWSRRWRQRTPWRPSRGVRCCW